MTTTKKKLRKALSSWKDIEVPLVFVDNGCSCSPDYFWSIGCLSDICRVHDYLYSIGGTEKDRKDADKILRNGMIEKAFDYGVFRMSLGIFWAFNYYFFTRLWGCYFYTYSSEKEAAKGKRFRPLTKWFMPSKIRGKL